MLITTRNRGGRFGSDQWIEGVSGAAIGTDAAPTTLASVAAARRIPIPKRALMTPALQISAFAIDGSGTCAGRFWWHDAERNLWVPNGAAVTLTTLTTNSGVNTVGCMPGSLWFFQVTANTGNTTLISIVIR